MDPTERKEILSSIKKEFGINHMINDQGFSVLWEGSMVFRDVTRGLWRSEPPTANIGIICKIVFRKCYVGSATDDLYQTYENQRKLPCPIEMNEIRQ